MAALFAVSVACAGRKPAPLASAPREGKTSYRIILPPGGGGGGSVEAAETITPVYASSENTPPTYPDYTLTAGCREGTVPVRVHIGADGNVVDQRDIPERPLPADLCHLAFRAAVQEAVASWKFAPAFRQTKIPDPEGLGRGRWEQTAVRIYVDYEFLFRVEQGKGVVLTR